MIGVVDYGVGNVGSVINMLGRLNVPARKVSSQVELDSSERLILPGIGSFDHAMRALRDRGLIERLNYQVRELGKPTLGICLGMQMMGDSSEEGTDAGLGWISGKTSRFAFLPDEKVKIPHMGWAYVEAGNTHPLLPDDIANARYYFVHSFHFRPTDPAAQLLTFNYGGKTFVAAIANGNVAGFQFHPEKSHRFGMALLARFAKWKPNARLST